jgi:hypothetical protein
MAQPNPRTIRRLGWLLLVLGLFLVGLMGTIIWRMYPSMSHPGIPDASGSTWTGTAAQGHDALQLFGLVIAFGVVSVLNGVWQIATGRRNLLFVAVTVALVAVMYLFGRSIVRG